jgi:hypothetical protein
MGGLERQMAQVSGLEVGRSRGCGKPGGSIAFQLTGRKRPVIRLPLVPGRLDRHAIVAKLGDIRNGKRV